MDSLQFATAVRQAVGSSVWDVFGPFRGVVRAGCPQFPDGLSGRYTRVWLTNGYGILAMESGDGHIMIIPIRHGGPEYGETTWTPCRMDGERIMGHAWVLTMDNATTDDAALTLCRLYGHPGHSMTDVG